MNNVLISGKLEHDPYFQVRDRKNGQGQYNQASYTIVSVQRARDGTVTENHFDIDVFGDLANAAKEYLHQGSPVTLRGMLRSNSYTTRRGEKMNSISFQAFEQESPDIPEVDSAKGHAGPEANRELPERTGSAEDDEYAFAEKDYF